jgi:GLPGLI family protein
MNRENEINMYKIITLLFVIVMNLPVCGQMRTLSFENSFTTIDTLRLEILYQLDFVNDTLKPAEKLADEQVLQIGFHTSKYFSQLLFKNDSINTILEAQNAENIFSPPKAAAEYEVVRNRNAKTCEVTYRSDDIVFRYLEDIPVISWIIHDEKKTIQQYACQRATCSFRGREYEAWFTNEIPLREGPFKFGGLPGLILEMQDSQKHFVYTCMGIRKPKSVEPIRIRNWPYTETSREKLHDFLVRVHQNPVEYYNSRGATFAIHVDGKFIMNPKNHSLPFNPIELE